jgi:hypothetical protein
MVGRQQPALLSAHPCAGRLIRTKDVVGEVKAMQSRKDALPTGRRSNTERVADAPRTRKLHSIGSGASPPRHDLTRKGLRARPSLQRQDSLKTLALAKVRYPSSKNQILSSVQQQFAEILSQLVTLSDRTFKDRRDIEQDLEGNRWRRGRDKTTQNGAPLPRVSAARFASCLRGVDFPAGKEMLLEAAMENGAPDDVLKVLDEIPAKVYPGVKSVMREFGKLK